MLAVIIAVQIAIGETADTFRAPAPSGRGSGDAGTGAIIILLVGATSGAAEGGAESHRGGGTSDRIGR